MAGLELDGQEACDITNAADVERAVLRVRPDYVIHLAGISFVAFGNAEDYYRVHVIGTLNLLNALDKLKIPPAKVILASSANVYGTPAVEVLHESLCPEPISHYGSSKLAMEHMSRGLFNRIPIIITRPFNYTGPGQAGRFLVPKIVQHFKDKAPFIELGNLHVSRDYSDVDDVVAAYIGLLQGDARSEVVNVCSGRSIALLEILNLMKEITGHDIEVRVNPAFVRNNEVPRLVGDPSKLRRMVTLTPPRPFRDTLQRMVES